MKTFYGIVDTVTEGSLCDIFSRIAKGSTKEEAIEEARLDWWKYTTPDERKNRVITVREVEIDVTPDMDEKDIKEAVMDALTESEDYFHIFDQDSVEGPVYFEDLTDGQETGILIWRNHNNNGRWEIYVGNWNHIQYQTTISHNGQDFPLDARHKKIDVYDLTEYLTRKGELWASVEDDQDDDIPKLLEEHMGGTLYDYGDLRIILPDEWN